jgi:DNA-directed RNA polymerase subunit omega
MIDIDMEERLVEKIGGKFKLTTLIQRRLVELNRGVKALVDADGTVPHGAGPLKPQELIKLIVREIMEGKIALAPKSEIGLSMEEEVASAKKGAVPEVDIFGEELKKIKEERLKELTTILQPSLAVTEDDDDAGDEAEAEEE